MRLDLYKEFSNFFSCFFSIAHTFLLHPFTNQANRTNRSVKRKRKHTMRLNTCTNGSANTTSDLQQHLRLVFDDISVLMLSEKGRGLASISLADGETH